MNSTDFKPGDVVICSGAGWGVAEGSICYIDKRGRLEHKSEEMYGVTFLFPSGPHWDSWQAGNVAGAAASNMQKIGHIPELLND